ncbi:MAG: hypothetical protein KIT14_06650 [bacterium]|nr:hypothetical protein [bacterium]
MRRLVLLVLVLPVAIFGAFIGALLLASETVGEVVVVHSRAADGGEKATRLWIAEDDAGTLWLRGKDGSPWLVHIATNPVIQVDRGDGSTVPMRATAVDDPATREKVHALMQRDYGAVDSVIAAMRDPDTSVPVRLEPAS